MASKKQLKKQRAKARAEQRAQTRRLRGDKKAKKGTAAYFGINRRLNREKKQLVNMRKRLKSDPDNEKLKDEISEQAQKVADIRLERDEALDSLAGAKATVARLTKRIEKKEGGKVVRLKRSQWGARGPRGSYIRNTSISRAIIHHTAVSIRFATSIKDAASQMRALQALHMNQGWTDVGYHEVLFQLPNGRVVICEGRPAWAVGAHAMNNNTGTFGISGQGNFDNWAPTRQLVRAMHNTRKRFCSGAKVIGHYEVNPTACPGSNMKPELEKI